MTITSKTLVIALIIVGGLLFLWPKPTSPFYETRQNSDGGVTVSVTPITLEPEEKPQFQISFETHSVDLDFDVSEIAALADDQGNTLGQASWDGTPAGGHHRSGTLTFAETIPQHAKRVMLTLRAIAGMDRILTWEVQQ